MNTAKNSWVYVIQIGSDGPVKIGTARDVGKRLSQLQGASVELLHLRAAVRGGMELEKKLHRDLSRHRLRGEWFQMCEEVAALIETADNREYPGTIFKPHVGERMPPDEAYKIWVDKRFLVRDALPKMLGWTYHQALRQFGPRPVSRTTSERARAMRAAQLAVAEPGVVDRWTKDPSMKATRERWAQHWRDIAYRSAREALDAMPEEIRAEMGSLETARRIFGRRRPGDPSAGGRPPKKPKRKTKRT